LRVNGSFLVGIEQIKPMKTLRFILVIFTLAILMPHIATTSHIADGPQSVDDGAPGASLPRIYDLDVTSEIYEMVDQDRYRNYVKEFTEGGPRHVYMDVDIPGSQNEISRHWLVDKMTEVSNGRLDIELVGDYMNIVGCLPGYLPGNNPVFVMSAHYDTRPLCPGANDDGSGIAAVLELLGVMSQFEWPLDIYFIAFNGAEAKYDTLTPPPGRLQGSEEVAQVFVDRGIEILAHFDVGPILREANHASEHERVFLSYYDLGSSKYHVSQYWAELGKAISNWRGDDVVRTVPSSSFIEFYRDDITKFTAKELNSVVLAFESGLADDSAYQSTEDLWYRSDYSYRIGKDVTALIGGCMAYTMSKSYGEANRLIFEGVAYSGFSLRHFIPVSMATTIIVNARWFGSSADFLVYNPSGLLIASSFQTDTNPWNYTQIFSIPVTQKGLYLIEVWDTGEDSLGLDSYIDYEVDTNGNGVSDQYEYWLDTSLFNVDSDSDSISDALEIIYGTDSTKADSDGDGIPDNWELENDMDPTNPIDALLDFDNDTLTNLQEFSYGLNPNSADSDMDQLPDAWEIAVGLNPLVNDADEDPDGDNLTNLEEYQRGTNPLVSNEEEPPYILWIGIPAAALIFLGVAIFLVKRE